MSKDYESFFLELENYISQMLNFTEFSLTKYLDAIISTKDDQQINDTDKKKLLNFMNYLVI